MAATVKQKIRYGTLFLFAMLLIAAGIGLFHIFRLKKDSNLILQNNYESVQYVHVMLRALDSMGFDGKLHKANFNNSLQSQEKNITEKNEGALTADIRLKFDSLNDTLIPPATVLAIKNDLNAILALNMQAIALKNERASVTATKALTYISLIAGLVFVVGFSFVYNFPTIITDPINEIAEGIREITNKNYEHRIRYKRDDEFGEVATAFNAMADRLEVFENSNLNQIMFQKARAEAVVNSLKDASIGIDKDNIVLFANDQALKLLHLEAAQIVEKPVTEVEKGNDLFRFLLGESSNVPFKIVVDNRENYFVKEVNEIN
ncbi:MAG: HAMP domain-containing protein, partial [Chitinophagaceae bacterium]